MSFNSFGRLLRVTTWGESHGPALGAVIDGCPPGLDLSEADLQPWLDKRKPGSSRFTTQRREADQVQILSGTFEGRTTGTPISLLIQNQDQRSKDYSDVARAYRPGHADYTYDAKYGVRDWRGGGRSSARETAARVAAAGVARLIVPEVRIRAYLVELGGDAIDRKSFDADCSRNQSAQLPGPAAAALAGRRSSTLRARQARRSGQWSNVLPTSVPAGWGAPVYAKLDSELAAADDVYQRSQGGRDRRRLRGRKLRWRGQCRRNARRAAFLSNHAGGILGGISTGQPVVVRVAFKPTSSILTPVQTIDRHGNETEISTRGRHDPCVGIRAVPIVEAMMALVLADQKLLHRGQCG